MTSKINTLRHSYLVFLMLVQLFNFAAAYIYCFSLHVFALTARRRTELLGLKALTLIASTLFLVDYCILYARVVCSDVTTVHEPNGT